MDQDWEPVVVRRSSGVGHKSSYAATGAAGRTLVTRTGDQATTDAVKKLEATEIGRPKQLSSESRTEIVQKRIAVGKSQVQLNQDCRFPVNTMREIESGRLCPTPQQLSVLNRVLKAQLKYL
jgi:ribosome-binding protein aMBF1 (putative translation factor)